MALLQVVYTGGLGRNRRLAKLRPIFRYISEIVQDGDIVIV